ncbi:MAG: hypothetical protein AAGJ40_21915 [Planctomycetota bacterium]
MTAVADKKTNFESAATISLAERRILQAAMADPDAFVLELAYEDSTGQRTKRVVSPIRFVTRDRFLGLCLCRQQPRQFRLTGCSEFRLIPSAQVVMPIAMLALSKKN